MKEKGVHSSQQITISTSQYNNVVSVSDKNLQLDTLSHTQQLANCSEEKTHTHTSCYLLKRLLYFLVACMFCVCFARRMFSTLSLPNKNTLSWDDWCPCIFTLFSDSIFGQREQSNVIFCENQVFLGVQKNCFPDWYLLSKRVICSRKTFNDAFHSILH